MEKIPNGKYTKEFREEAVNLVTVKKKYFLTPLQEKRGELLSPFL